MSRPYITISIGRLIKGISTEDISIKNLLTRQVAIEGLWNEMNNCKCLTWIHSTQLLRCVRKG